MCRAPKPSLNACFAPVQMWRLMQAGPLNRSVNGAAEELLPPSPLPPQPAPGGNGARHFRSGSGGSSGGGGEDLYGCSNPYGSYGGSPGSSPVGTSPSIALPIQRVRQSLLRYRALTWSGCCCLQMSARECMAACSPSSSLCPADQGLSAGSSSRESSVEQIPGPWNTARGSNLCSPDLWLWHPRAGSGRRRQHRRSRGRQAWRRTRKLVRQPLRHQ